MIHPPDRPTALGAGGDNAIAHAIGLAADEWLLLVLRHALQHGFTEYAQWRGVLPISAAVLTSRLRRLVEQGIFTPTGDEDDSPQDRRYHLTRRGAGLWPLMTVVWGWEARWASGQGDRMPLMGHRLCGKRFLPEMACGGCREVVDPREVTGEFGPSGSWPRSAPDTTLRRRSSGSANLGPKFFPESRTLIGNRWSAAMLGAAFLGATRFAHFQRRLGAPGTVIGDRLDTFVRIGVLRPGVGPGHPGRGSYRLTDKGRAFFPVVMAGIQWSQRWFVAPEGPAVVFGHRGCERGFAMLLVCSACSQPLSGREIEVD